MRVDTFHLDFRLYKAESLDVGKMTWWFPLSVSFVMTFQNYESFLEVFKQYSLLWWCTWSES